MLCLHSRTSECNATRLLDAAGGFPGCTSGSATGWMGCYAGQVVLCKYAIVLWSPAHSKIDRPPPLPSGGSRAGAAAAGPCSGESMRKARWLGQPAASSACSSVAGGRRNSRRRASSSGRPPGRARGRSSRMGCNIDKVGGQVARRGARMSLPIIELPLGGPCGARLPLLPRTGDAGITEQRSQRVTRCLLAAAAPPPLPPPPAPSLVVRPTTASPPLPISPQMLIKGIRSFSPDNQNVRHSGHGRVLSWFTPLRAAANACLPAPGCESAHGRRTY